jgi:hypothetical protein
MELLNALSKPSRNCGRNRVLLTICFWRYFTSKTRRVRTRVSRPLNCFSVVNSVPLSSPSCASFRVRGQFIQTCFVTVSSGKRRTTTVTPPLVLLLLYILVNARIFVTRTFLHSLWKYSAQPLSRERTISG